MSWQMRLIVSASGILKTRRLCILKNQILTEEMMSVIFVCIIKMCICSFFSLEEQAYSNQKCDLCDIHDMYVCVSLPFFLPWYSVFYCVTIWGHSLPNDSFLLFGFHDTEWSSKKGRMCRVQSLPVVVSYENSFCSLAVIPIWVRVNLAEGEGLAGVAWLTQINRAGGTHGCLRTVVNLWLIWLAVYFIAK